MVYQDTSYVEQANLLQTLNDGTILTICVRSWWMSNFILSSGKPIPLLSQIVTLRQHHSTDDCNECTISSICCNRPISSLTTKEPMEHLINWHPIPKHSVTKLYQMLSVLQSHSNEGTYLHTINPKGPPTKHHNTNTFVNGKDSRKVKEDKYRNSRFSSKSQCKHEYLCTYAQPLCLSVILPKLPLHTHPGIILIRWGTCESLGWELLVAGIWHGARKSIMCFTNWLLVFTCLCLGPAPKVNLPRV